MSDRTYSVPSMSCGHCQATIESALSGLDGVEAVVVDLSTRTVKVAGGASDEAIRSALVDAGYEVAGVA